MISSQKFLGNRRTTNIVKLVEIPGGFSLRWINIFFTPAFITLPLSSWISAKEALTIAAVFLIGYFVATATIAYFTVLLQLLLKKTRRSNVERAEELNLMEDGDDSLDGNTTGLTSNNDLLGSPIRSAASIATTPSVYDFRESIGSMAPSELNKIRSLERNPDNIVHDIPRGDENSIEDEFRKSLSLSRHQSTFSKHQNDRFDDHIQLSTSNDQESSETDVVKIELQTNKSSKTLEFPKAPRPVAQPTRPNNPGTEAKMNAFNKLLCKRSLLEQNPMLQTDRRIIIGEFIFKKFDYLVLFSLFIASLPIYFIRGYAMFLHLSIAVAAFIFMLNVPPPKYKKFLHPVLCSVGISWFFFYIFSLMKSENFLDTLRQYKTGRNYLKLFNHKTNDKWPGAGDVFSTCMDVSIVSLSIPMYTYRNDLKRHFLALLPPILLMSFGCFFIYPPVCYKLGISSQRSLGFAGRSVTLALGTPFVQALDGSVPLMAVTTVVSGIVGALTGQFVFGKKVLRLRDDDYVTRGITLGVNCGAIATAHLLTIDPRAAAMSSLSFVLFGTIMVIMASITPLANLVKGWAGVEV